jgi:7-carboxy-7-deazaguanine synthase
MKVNEIFYSLQGEGNRVGDPSIFIRLSNCNLTCSFCDTEFESYIEMSIDEILNECKKYNCKWIVWTGGEPTLQLNKDIVDIFKNNGYKQAIETNGTNKIDYDIDWITISPKVAEHVLVKNFSKVNELKYVIHKGKGIPKPLLNADNYYISPKSSGDVIVKENIDYCIKLCLENPTWKLTLQNHKLWRIR